MATRVRIANTRQQTDGFAPHRNPYKKHHGTIEERPADPQRDYWEATHGINPNPRRAEQILRDAKAAGIKIDKNPENRGGSWGKMRSINPSTASRGIQAALKNFNQNILHRAKSNSTT